MIPVTSHDPQVTRLNGSGTPALTTGHWPLATALLLCLSGCSLNRLAVKAAAPVVDRGLTAIYRERDPQFAREALPANLKLMEVLLESDTGNQKLLLNAAMGFCGYGFMFIEDESEARASELYRKGAAYALRALTLKGAAADGAVDPLALKKRTAPAAFWHTFCRASYVNLNRDDPDAVAELPKIMPVAERLAGIAPDYYYNGAYAMLGTYYALRPKILGGDPEKAKLNFDKAMRDGGEGFLLNAYMAARMYAVAAQDEDYFVKVLNGILSADLKDDEARLANEVARVKARKLLEKKDELF